MGTTHKKRTKKRKCKFKSRIGDDERLHYLNLFTPVELVDGEVLPAHGQRPLVDLGQLLLLHHVGEAATLFHDWQLRKKISITLGLVKTEPFRNKAFISSKSSCYYPLPSGLGLLYKS